MNARGQNLVLLALSMLLLTFLVLMTLSIGMKAKARMELQTVADATAYSNSVATARTMNSIAVMRYFSTVAASGTAIHAVSTTTGSCSMNVGHAPVL